MDSSEHERRITTQDVEDAARLLQRLDERAKQISEKPESPGLARDGEALGLSGMPPRFADNDDRRGDFHVLAVFREGTANRQCSAPCPEEIDGTKNAQGKPYAPGVR